MHTATRPDLARLPASVKLELADVALAGGESGEPRRFAMLAYTGKVVDLGFGPIVFDLGTMELPASDAPAFRQHNPEKWVGSIGEVENDGAQIKVAGQFFQGVAEADEVQRIADQGGKWQASVGLWLNVRAMDWVDEESEVEVNGRSIEGPCLVARQTKLKEVSFVPLGADDDTEAAALAAPEDRMAADNKNDPVKAERERVRDLRAQFKADPTFALEAIDQGWSVTEAKAQLSDRLSARLEDEDKEKEEMKAELEKLKAKLEAMEEDKDKQKEEEAKAAARVAGRPSPGAQLGGAPGAAPSGGSEPVQAFEQAVRDEVARLEERGSQGDRAFVERMPGLEPAAARRAALRREATFAVRYREPELAASYRDAIEERRAGARAAMERAKAQAFGR